MKDRNGKRMRSGDVCVLHTEDRRLFGKPTEIFNVRNGDKTIKVKSERTGRTLRKAVPSTDYEIIGSVR